MEQTKKIPIVYIVAGLSSRFGGKIKQFAQVGPDGETLIEYSMKQAKEAGVSEFIFVVGKMTEVPFKEKFGDSYLGLPVRYAKQVFDEETRDRPWGTGDALCAARDYLRGPFVFAYGDDLYGKSTFKTIVDFLKSSDENVIVGHRLGDVLVESGTVNRGTMEIDENGYVLDMVENLGIDRNNLAQRGLNEDMRCSMGAFGFQKEFLDRLYADLEKFKIENAGDRKIEYILSGMVGEYTRGGIIRMRHFPASERWFGVTNPDDEFIVREELKRLKGLKG